MANPNCIVLHVADPMASAAFYQTLLERPPVEASPGFAMFALDAGVLLGLWARDDVEPASNGVGGFELGFELGDRDAVASCFREWQQRGLRISQPPTDMDFGHTFVALDPDGHRLRVFAPHPAA